MEQKNMEAQAEHSPLLVIKNRNASSIKQLNIVLSETLGHKLGRLMSAGIGILFEYILLAIALGVFLFIFMMEKVSPFYILAQMRENQAVQDALNPHIINNFTMVIQVIIGLVAFFIFTTALALRRVRKNKSNMHDAIITLRDVRDEMEMNDKQLETLDEVSNQMLEAATLVANESTDD